MTKSILQSLRVVKGYSPCFNVHPGKRAAFVRDLQNATQFGVYLTHNELRILEGTSNA